MIETNSFSERFKELYLSKRVYPALPLAGMCGGGSSGSIGAEIIVLLSNFCLGAFLGAFGE